MSALKNMFFGLLAVAFYTITSCRVRGDLPADHVARIDVRFGSRFYTVFIPETGKAFGIKGESSDYMAPFKINNSDTSKSLRLDSVQQFFHRLNSLLTSPMVIDHNSDAPRVEIYYDQKKIYDGHKWDEDFWDLVRPIAGQIPKEFNPFLVEPSPFR
jgi:hypothetical protein